MVKLVAEIPQEHGFVRRVYEGNTVAESFVVIGMAGNHFSSALRERDLRISELLTKEARLNAQESRIQKSLLVLRMSVRQIEEKKDV